MQLKQFQIQISDTSISFHLIAYEIMKKATNSGAAFKNLSFGDFLKKPPGFSGGSRLRHCKMKARSEYGVERKCYRQGRGEAIGAGGTEATGTTGATGAVGATTLQDETQRINDTYNVKLIHFLSRSVSNFHFINFIQTLIFSSKTYFSKILTSFLTYILGVKKSVFSSTPPLNPNQRGL